MAFWLFFSMFGLNSVVNDPKPMETRHAFLCIEWYVNVDISREPRELGWLKLINVYFVYMDMMLVLINKTGQSLRQLWRGDH